MEVEKTVIYFSKVNPNGKIPSKRKEDAGYDLYACFEEEQIIIQPNEICLVPTGIATAFNSNYVLIVKERSSSGSKGLAVRMGVIDSGYRGEIMVGLNNTNNRPIIITKKSDYNDSGTILYPYNKAIAQAILLVVPNVLINEIPYDELLKYVSERKDSFLGASGK